MTATAIITANIHVTLTAAEAAWLLGFLQNAHDANEPPAEEAMRGDIFDGLKSALSGIPKIPPQ